MLTYAYLATATLLRSILGRPVPLFASWNLTFRCNRRCAYCGADRVPQEELDTRSAVLGLNALRRAGTRFVTFGGGEPLLRQDLGILVRHARRHGITPFISTNGSLVPERIEELRGAARITLSLDGPPAAHDAVRGTGAYGEVVRAIAACRERGVPVALQCTLGRHNLDCVGELLQIARDRGVRVMFQPATLTLDSTTAPNPVAPPAEAYRRTMKELLRRKRDGAPIANSEAALKHLARWPEPTSILCGAARYFCCVEPDGRVLACHQAQSGQLVESRDGLTVRTGARALRRVPAPSGCRECWCAPIVELAMIFSGRPSSIVNAARVA